jgi:hypothetical protein
MLKSVSGDTLKQLGGLIGEGENQTKSAVAAALPALMAALGGVTTTSSGAQKLASAVEQADDGILGNLGGLLGGQGSAVADRGGSLLDSLLPGGIMENLGPVLSRFTGMNSSSITKLLGVLAPIVLAYLKRETKSSGSSPAAVSKLLASQKDNIAAALPSGLGSVLGSIPGIGDFASLAHGARDTAAAAVNKAAVAGSRAKSAASEGVGALRWVVPAIALVALAWVAWTYWISPRVSEPIAGNTEVRPVQVTASKITGEIAQQVSKVTDGVDDVFADATRAFKGVTDVESAEKAAPKIDEMTRRLEQLQKLAGTIPDAQRKTIAENVAKSRSLLMTVIEAAMKIPGVSDVLGPHVDRLKDVLDAFVA